MIVDKDFCLSSFLALRYVYDDGFEFYSNSGYKNKILPTPTAEIRNKEDIDDFLRKFFDEIYSKYRKVGILLSGGIDSAILASYLRPGSYAYTFVAEGTSCFEQDFLLASIYAKRNNLIHKEVKISFKDYMVCLPGLMINKGCPVSSIEPQMFKAAIQAKEDGVDVLLNGNSADDVFGGLSKIFSKDWSYDEFVEFFSIINPETILNKPKDIKYAFEPYRIKGDKIDYQLFVKERFDVESYGSYCNPSEVSGLPFIDPYENMYLGFPLDIYRIRNGEPKYLLVDLYKKIYRGITVPAKLPMPRPVDRIFANWKGPKRSEFRKDIDMSSLTGNQKWQIWCAEYFLNVLDSYEIA